MREDPSAPDFWNGRYAAGRTPWEQRGAPAALLRFLAQHPGKGGRVLIPGCGSGYEIVAFTDAGYDVTAIDFSPPAVARAREHIGGELARRVLVADFFTHDFAPAAFYLIYERTFLCALPVGRWPEIVTRTATLLRPGGILAGIYFLGDKDDGPPFGLSLAEVGPLFGSHFDLVSDTPIPAGESLPLYADHEHWQERRRRG
jgi:SAM-dependent methyltransferase